MDDRDDDVHVPSASFWSKSGDLSEENDLCAPYLATQTWLNEKIMPTSAEANSLQPPRTVSHPEMSQLFSLKGCTTSINQKEHHLFSFVGNHHYDCYCRSYCNIHFFLAGLDLHVSNDRRPRMPNLTPTGEEEENDHRYQGRVVLTGPSRRLNSLGRRLVLANQSAETERDSISFPWRRLVPASSTCFL